MDIMTPSTIRSQIRHRPTNRAATVQPVAVRSRKSQHYTADVVTEDYEYYPQSRPSRTTTNPSSVVQKGRQRSQQPANPGRREIMKNCLGLFGGMATTGVLCCVGPFGVSVYRNNAEKTSYPYAVIQSIRVGKPFDTDTQKSTILCYVTPDMLLKVHLDYPNRKQSQILTPADPLLLHDFIGTHEEQRIEVRTRTDKAGCVDSILFVIRSPLNEWNQRKEVFALVQRDASGFHFVTLTQQQLAATNGK